MESRLVRIGWIVMLVLGAYWAFCGFYCIAAPGAILEPMFEQMAGQSWVSFVAANPLATADFVQMEITLDGIAQLALAALLVAITLTGYRRGQKWSWYGLLAGGMIYWVGFLIHHLIIEADPMIPIIGLVLLVIALAVPAKDMLTKKSS